MPDSMTLTSRSSEVTKKDDMESEIQTPPTSIFSLAPVILAAVKEAKLELANTLSLYSRLSVSTLIRHKLRLRRVLTKTRDSMSDLETTVAQLISLQKAFAGSDIDTEEIDIEAKNIYRAGMSAGSHWFGLKTDCTRSCLLDLELDLENIIGDPYRPPWGSPDSVRQSLVYSYKTAWCLRSLVEMIGRMDGISQQSTSSTRGEESQAKVRLSKRARESGEEDEETESNIRSAKRRNLD